MESPSPLPGPPAPPIKIARPELLAPAGDWECAQAAVENGADAIYFGVDRFNARMRARNFTVADLPRLMDFLHRRGVRGYVTFNILVFTEEWAEAETTLRALIAAGVDAAIIQDVGLCRLARQISPDFPLHASTQMTITTAAGLEFARDLGCGLVALARECSLAEMVQIQASRAAAKAGADPGSTPFPLEVFVHGALCVAFSGQCLTSEALGGRSANRGVCAQACRLPYTLVCDGQPVNLGDRRYLLSPRDLAGLELVPELIRVGVTSLKIEGRLKSPAYVANITRLYRQAIDRYCGAPPGSDPPEPLDRNARYAMEMAFSRGLYTGWLRGTQNQELVHGRFGKKRGVFLGRVLRCDDRSVTLRLESPLKPGDGVGFDAGQPDQPEEGGRVYTVTSRGTETRITFGDGALDFHRVHPGDRIWKTSDPELERHWRRSYSGAIPKFRRPLRLTVTGRAGQPLTLTAEDERGHQITVASTLPLVEAVRQPLTDERLRDQLGRLGGTPFVLGALSSRLEGPVLLPISELNRLRREFVQGLEAARVGDCRWTLQAGPVPPPAALGAASSPDPDALGPAELSVLIRTAEQLDAALQSGMRTVYADFDDLGQYGRAVARVRQSPGRAIWVAPPRMAKPGEADLLRQTRACQADGYLVRNYDHLIFFADDRCVGDYSLNIANPWSAEYFKNRYRLERVTAAYDLNPEQLLDLVRAAPPAWFELVIHQHIPMFHMAHCLYGAFLSRGRDNTECGRPCEKHQVHLRDRVGSAHPVRADAGCRNTVFHARAQTSAEYVARFLEAGVRSFRLEFLDETPAQIERTLDRYQQLLRGEISGAELWRDLKLWNQAGITRGPE